MADNLEAIRAKRLEQLQSQYQGNPDSQKATEEAKEEEDVMKNIILSQVLNQPARARLNTLMLGKPAKGKMVESMLLQMARSGQIMGKLGETDLISILESVNQKMQQSTAVIYDRRRAAVDSDDDM